MVVLSAIISLSLDIGLFVEVKLSTKVFDMKYSRFLVLIMDVIDIQNPYRPYRHVLYLISRQIYQFLHILCIYRRPRCRLRNYF